MKIDVRHRCSDFQSYRAARVKSLFNVETGANFELSAELPIDDHDWRVGLIVGPSGSGKSSLGRQVWGAEAMYCPAWPERRPIVEAIAPRGEFDAVTSALASVGLGSVPAWLRPYAVLSNGERFRADLARVICDAPSRAWSSTSSVRLWIARLPRSARWRSRRRGGARADNVSSSPATTTSSTGWSPTGSSTPGPEDSPGGDFGGGLDSTWRYGRRTGVTGRCLSRITI